MVDTILVDPTEDTFSRANAPTATYGMSGALHVAGPLAENSLGHMNGEADTWLRFDTAAAIQQFNLSFGVGNWTIDSIALSLREVATPGQMLFSRGIGDFQVDWILNDDWSEGSGSPGGAGGPPGTATGNQIGWSHGQSLLGAGDRVLGTFQNAGLDSRQDFALSLDADFLADVLSAGPDLTLRLSAASDTIGFTFYSGSVGVPEGSSQPQLIINVVPEPATVILLPFAMIIAGRNRRRSCQR